MNSETVTVLHPDAPKPQKKGAGPSIPTVLVELARRRYGFGLSTLGEPFALPKEGPRIVTLLRGSKSSLRNQLARLYFEKTRSAPPQQALADALLVIEGMAQECEPVDLHLRVASAGESLYLDLGDATGRAVAIRPGEWCIEDSPPVLFKRTTLTGALPDPERGESLERLWPWLNVAEDDRPLVAAWLVAALFPNIPHPVLSLQGEQGTAKTTAQKILLSILDASPVLSRKPPRDPDSWVTSAAGSWLVGIDNLSEIRDWLSDSICRAVTGDGDVRRRLYTDGDFTVFAFRRVVCLTSIDLGSLRGDLSERLLPIALQPIPEARRRKEAEIMRAWAAAHPRVLGAVLDLAAGTLGALPSVELTKSPRMADFAEILAAVDLVLGTRGLPRYVEEISGMDRDALASDPFMAALMELASFEGTAAELYRRLAPEKEKPEGWPRNARAVTQLLRRMAPSLRRVGWVVADDGGNNHRKILRWSLAASDTYLSRKSSPQPPQPPQTQPPQSPQRGRQPPQSPQEGTPQPPQNQGGAGVAGVAGEEYGKSTCPTCGGAGCAWCETDPREPGEDDDLPF